MIHYFFMQRNGKSLMQSFYLTDDEIVEIQPIENVPGKCVTDNKNSPCILPFKVW